MRNRKGQFHGQDSNDKAKGVYTAVNHRRDIQRKSLEVNSLFGSQRYGMQDTNPNFNGESCNYRRQLFC
jgi:hypothetical protein